VHRVLEGLDLARPVAETLAETDASLATAVATLAPPPLREAVTARASRVLSGLRGGELVRRFERIRHHVLARELPVLLPAGAADDAVAFVAGSIDLVHRDPLDGGLVVVDFKTDEVRSARELADRASHHAAQGAHYARALQEALDLPRAPRVELWFLSADRCVASDDAAASADAAEQLSLTLA
jgi:ATP-dependent exoDNAse (exonuclease V) beta subunit